MEPKNIPLLRVAAYCRVSTDREDQANSLQSQQTYFAAYIQTHRSWRLTGVYADEGISGTSTRRREAFNRMVAQAEAGELDLILTKEVSRFARNTVDALEYTRRLKRLGVGVIFINDNIDTRENDGELRLTIMASIAQEESRKTSERVKWGQLRRMEAGVVFGNNSTYGFDTRHGRLSVKPEEAEVVRLIYHKFLNEGKGTHVIARELYEAGIPPPRTAETWSCVMVLRVLRNEKHVGDLLQKKHVTPDYLTHKKVLNRGQEEQILLRNHHEAIVDRAVWDAAQQELARRGAAQGDKSKYSNRYWCSGKLRCGGCGSRFVLRRKKRSSGLVYMAWGCHSRIHRGGWRRDGQAEGCKMRMVNDKSLSAVMAFVLERLELDCAAVAASLLDGLEKLERAPDRKGSADRLRARKAAVERKRENALDAFLSEKISDGELQAMRARYARELEGIEKQLQALADAAREQEAAPRREELAQLLQAGVSGWPEVWREVVERVTVFEDCLEVQLKYVPGAFRVWYASGGKGEAYTTAIQRWEWV